MFKNGLIYQPQGPAREYSALALNVYKDGCDYNCGYCYAPALLRKTRADFAHPVMKYDKLEFLVRLERQATKLRDAGYARNQVLLSFISDPYQHLNEIHQLTGRVIYTLKAHDFSVNILTKGGNRSMADFYQLDSNDAYGITLTYLRDGDALTVEPGAARPAERIAALKEADRRGLQTWVSLEPLLSYDAVAAIDRLAPYVSFFKIGALQHNTIPLSVEYRELVPTVLSVLKDNHAKYYFKDSLLPWLPSRSDRSNIEFPGLVKAPPLGRQGRLF